MWPVDPNRQHMYQNYANAWDQGTYNQLSNQEVQQNYQQFVQNAPPLCILLTLSVQGNRSQWEHSLWLSLSKHRLTREII